METQVTLHSPEMGTTTQPMYVLFRKEHYFQKLRQSPQFILVERTLGWESEDFNSVSVASYLKALGKSLCLLALVSLFIKCARAKMNTCVQ